MKDNRKKSFEESLFESLEEYGYTLPETDKEVEQYLQNIGSTKLELSERLSDPDLIYYEAMSEKSGVIDSIAAHEQGDNTNLPDDFIDSLDERGEIINNNEKRKRKK